MSMRCMAFAFVAVLAAASGSMGQLAVELKVENASVLQYEPLRVTVIVQNNTAVPVVLGGEAEDAASLRFVVRRDDDKYIHPNDDALPFAAGVIEPGKRRELGLDLTRRFDMATALGYSVACSVEWKGSRYAATPVNVDVVKGMMLSEVQAGVVGDEGRIRTYALKYWRRGGNEHLFLAVVEPASGMSYGVFDLGLLVRVFQPTVVVEGSGRVKVRHQSGPDRYVMTVFESRANEVRFVDQTYHLENGDPYPVRGAKPEAVDAEPAGSTKKQSAPRPESGKKSGKK